MKNLIVPDWAKWNAIKVNDSIITCANGHSSEVNLGSYSPSTQAATYKLVANSTCSICDASLTLKRKGKS